MWYAVNSSTLPSIRGYPLKQALLHRFDGPVSLMNDATAAALGEARFGAGRGVDSLGYITVSTGIGGGIVLDGKPLISPNGLAGHVGFTSLRHATGRCGSGRVGTVESVASGRAIARAAERTGREGLDAKEVFSCALKGKAWASAIVRRSAEAISELSANLVAILGLERIVIGGSVGLAKGYAALVRECLSVEPVLFNTTIVKAELGQNSALYGVLSMAVSDSEAL
jgi:N-acylmannosamine kinase